MNTPTILLSPKGRFLQSNDNVSRHRAMLESREFERASDFSMVQYCAFIAESVKDANTACSAGFKLQGAFEYANTFRMLGEQPKMPAPVAKNDNLDHKV